MVVLFYKVLRRLLLKRGHELLDKGTLSDDDLRGFFYFNRQTLLDDYKHLDEIDSKATDSLYSNWGHTIMAKWLIDVGAPLLGLERKGPPGWVYSKSMDINEKKYCMWTRFREAFHLWPKPTAVCYGAGNPFLISRHTRELVTKKKSLILVCEKATIGQKLLDGLKAREYHVNVIGVGGCTVSNVAEVILREAEKMAQKTTNFWILVLHDFDVKGVEIVLRMKIWRWPCIIDVGINQEFLTYLKARHKIDKRIVEEPVVNKKFNRKLQEWIADDPGYSQEDFDYLQGTPYPAKDKKGKIKKTKKGKVKYHYRGHRIELDPIAMKYGIDVFIDFVEEKIESACRVWDLTRIGVSEEDFDLSNPDCRFTERMDEYKEPDYEKTTGIIDGYGALREFGGKVENLWGDLEPILMAPLDHAKEKILELVDTVYWDVEDAVIAQEDYEEFQPILDEYTELEKLSKEVMEQASTLREETVGEVLAIDESMKASLSDLEKQVKDDASALRIEYEDDFDIDWTEAYDEEHQAILGQVEYYEGDVRLGADDLKERTERLQEGIDSDSEYYPNFEEFNEKLEGLEQSHSEDQEQINTEIREGLEEIDSKLDGFDLQEERIDAFQGLDDRRILELMVETLQQKLEEIGD